MQSIVTECTYSSYLHSVKLKNSRVSLRTYSAERLVVVLYIGMQAPLYGNLAEYVF